MAVVWLASYPKSGNTWTRSFLANYRRDTDEPVDINALGGGMPQTARSVFDAIMCMPSEDMNRAEMQHYRPIYNALVVAEYKKLTFLKTHCAYYKTDAGVPFFPSDNDSRAIHIVRNPLDVAVSYAHHNDKSIDYSIEIMADKKFVMGGGASRMAERMLDWSGFCQSWIEQDALPTLTVRYEDMLSDPEATFGKMVEFSGMELEKSRLRKAIEFSSFKKLKAIEQVTGFKERQPTASSFFRKGVAGSWRESLNAKQIAKICADHGEMMRKMGYEIEQL